MKARNACRCVRFVVVVVVVVVVIEVVIDLTRHRPSSRQIYRFIADRSEFRGPRLEEDKTDQQVLRATNRKLACDGYRIDKDNDNDNDTDPCSALDVGNRVSPV